MKKIISLFAALFLLSSFVFAIDFNGVVKDDITQAPIAGALIRVYKANDQVASSKSATDGSFHIALAMGADYKVYIDKDGYEQLRVNITTNFSANIQELPPLELNLVKAKTGSSTTNTGAPEAMVVKLSGKVYHLQIGGLAGEEVLVKNLNTGISTAIRTSSNGNFSCTILPNMRYSISVIAHGTYPAYTYETVLLNTAGISSSIQIVRNFENKGEFVEAVVTNETKEVKTGTKEVKTTETKEVKTTTVPDKPVQNSKVAKEKTDASKKKDKAVLNDRDKELVDALNKKYEKLILADSLSKKKDKMVARNVEVRFYDDTVAKTKSTKKVLEEKKIEEVKTVSKDTVVAVKIKEKAIEPVKKVDTVAKKVVVPQEKKVLEKEVTKVVTTDTKSEEEKQRLAAQRALENKRIDSMIGTAPRFMHKEVVVKKEVTTNTSNPVNPLPIKDDETRNVVIENKIYYGEGKADLDAAAKQYLTELANKLKSNPTTKVEIAVHCDLNNEASIADFMCKLRIKRIVDLLVNQLNVNFQQLVIRSVGINEPVNNCKKDGAGCTDLDHQLNRRSEFKIMN